MTNSVVPVKVSNGSTVDVQPLTTGPQCTWLITGGSGATLACKGAVRVLPMPRTRSPGSTTPSRAQCGGTEPPRARGANVTLSRPSERPRRGPQRGGPFSCPGQVAGEIMRSCPRRPVTPRVWVRPRSACQLARPFSVTLGDKRRRTLAAPGGQAALRAGAGEPGAAHRPGGRHRGPLPQPRPGRGGQGDLPGAVHGENGPIS